MPRTTMTEQNEQESITVDYPSKLWDGRTITFGIWGQIPDRSYEDRDVFFEIHTSKTKEEAHSPDVNMSMWFNGEDAIALGLALIKHGNFAMKANMYQHQLIHHRRQLAGFVREGRVHSILFEKKDGLPSHYGRGFHNFLITPIWNKAPKYQRDFCFEDVIHWSPFAKNYKKDLKRHGYGVPILFVNYDHDLEVEKFNEECRAMEVGGGEPEGEEAEAPEKVEKSTGRS